MKKLFYITAIIAAGLSSCVDSPEYPVVPAINFVSLSRDTIQLTNNQFGSDSLLIKIDFTDGDGDLGSDENSGGTAVSQICGVLPDSFCSVVDTVPGFNLFYLNTRSFGSLRCLYPSRIPFIPEKGSSKAISGEITFYTTITGCLSPPVDTVSFLVLIRDRAGNCSNVVRTPPITVICAP